MDLNVQHGRIFSRVSIAQRYRKRQRTMNSVARLNEELRRRERVTRIFPNEESMTRLMGAIFWSTTSSGQRERNTMA